ncbi:MULTISPECIES: biotin--[acetyl-CoA-carboxylase] ligase [Clostridium]|uniref:Bifunctional ligase/repressor BirA n=1 Tax=Clostridium cadaveris TaxID=1529 RepID=A0A1I2JNH9_9CLOT|nr:biotin--[acetyl-CoA-carboxylase] ligase [Clostridium cadaveris]MDU4951234.1 biotin--[acetyl-CoA-carboxylase] ligase [Clostridium sp.]MDM8312107.1 biotin--[acetyl-CoA-carboxylase] ligase [Clostridium cadaveris]MDY4947835.1 biotin--[acetyl-CoA-carboxylase] ligase [Clostridium cadaveris]NME63922.1 biotin--[acetyl-CoA-carboxylase] ligase [Clostridium cadaveris]PWL51907.1 MAG: biotin--[acetyl-CoA-carboxylase] ligase [Clostridium cadaveris]
MKNEVLKILKNNIDSYTSGEDLSRILGVSRTSIWKYISSLKKEGYEFDSSTKLGYRLTKCPDILTFNEVEKFLSTSFIGRNYIHFNSIDSTNTKAKDLAKKGSPNGTVVICEEQSNGRGRLGRSWFSPKGKGLYFSIILRPNLSPLDISKLTLVGGAAVWKALSSLNIGSAIKWPNDIFINNRKVSGILTEISGELNQINYAVMGIGINVNTLKSEIPEDLREIATSLLIETNEIIDRKVLLSEILNIFERLYIDFVNSGSLKESLQICRENSLVLNKTLNCISTRESFTAKAKDINDNGELIVELSDGSTKNILCGEISIRNL